MNKKGKFTIFLTLAALLVSGALYAGSLNQTNPPTDPGTAMYTLEDIYNRLLDGTPGTKRAGAFTEPGAAPASTGHTLDDIYNLIDKRAFVPRTGQNGTVPIAAPAGSDGNLQKGVAWPNPRFTDNLDGTLTDNLTGLIWLKNAQCSDTAGGVTPALGKLNWTDALTWSGAMGNGICGLSDSSAPGDWRLPNARELYSLVDLRYFDPAVSNSAGSGQGNKNTSPGDPFNNLKTDDHYWTSTTYAVNTSTAWRVTLNGGFVSVDGKTAINYVLPVRGGH